MILRIHPGGCIPLQAAFRYFWGWYVTGFDPRFHCQPCLLGRRSIRVNRFSALAVDLRLDEVTNFDYFYVCGVSATRRWEDNFHLVVRHAPGNDAGASCYSGQRVTIHNAMSIEISGLPIGFNGKDRKFTTCRNYQFGVQAYQLSDDGGVLAPNNDGTYGVRLRRRRSQRFE